jgi:hypothetical protein
VSGSESEDVQEWWLTRDRAHRGQCLASETAEEHETR